MSTKTVSFIGEQWVERSERSDGYTIFAAFLAFVFSIALVCAVAHPADALGLQDDAIALSGP